MRKRNVTKLNFFFLILEINMLKMEIVSKSMHLQCDSQDSSSL